MPPKNAPTIRPSPFDVLSRVDEAAHRLSLHIHVLFLTTTDRSPNDINKGVCKAAHEEFILPCPISEYMNQVEILE